MAPLIGRFDLMSLYKGHIPQKRRHSPYHHCCNVSIYIYHIQNGRFAEWYRQLVGSEMLLLFSSCYVIVFVCYKMCLVSALFYCNYTSSCFLFKLNISSVTEYIGVCRRQPVLCNLCSRVCSYRTSMAWFILHSGVY